MSRVLSIGQEQVHIAIGSAARASGVDFDYLLAQARIESGLNPTAKATTSSATGLFQFTTSTWLSMLDRHGGSHGYGWASEAINRAGGRHSVQDPLLRQQILGLRLDPALSSAMAAEFAKENAAVLTPLLGRAPDHAELYLAHFLGAGGAGKFLTGLQSTPDASAAALFPSAASANRSIFYGKDGSAHSVSAVMGLIRNKVEHAKQEPGGAAGTSEPDLQPADQPPPFYQGPLAQEFGKRALPDRTAERQPMSSVLLNAFGGTRQTSSAHSAHVQSTYLKFQGFGL